LFSCGIQRTVCSVVHKLKRDIWWYNSNNIRWLFRKLVEMRIILRDQKQTLIIYGTTRYIVWTRSDRDRTINNGPFWLFRHDFYVLTYKNGSAIPPDIDQKFVQDLVFRKTVNRWRWRAYLSVNAVRTRIAGHFVSIVTISFPRRT